MPAGCGVLPASIRKTRISSTPFRPTTAMWSARRWWRAWCRRRMPFPQPDPAPGARTWRTTSSAWRSWRRSPATIPAWRRATPFRPAGEVRVMVKPEQVSEDQMVILARELAKTHRERAGVSRSDQGPCSAGDQSGGVRQVKLVHKNTACTLAYTQYFCDCRKTLRVFPTKGLQSAARIILSPWLKIPHWQPEMYFLSRTCRERK